MTANLPDNVTTETVYHVDSTAGSEINVSINEHGEVWIRQDGDRVVIAASAVPGLIAALQSAAGIPAPPDPDHVVDKDGDRWNRNEDGTYTLEGEAVGSRYAHRSLEYVRTYWGAAPTREVR